MSEFLQATLTFYNDQEDEFGSETAKKNPSGFFRAVHGFTIAVDPEVIPYGRYVEIPKLRDFSLNKNGVFYSHDTGSAVKSRHASIARGNDYPVIDVYASVRTPELNTLNGKYGYLIEYRILPTASEAFPPTQSDNLQV